MQFTSATRSVVTITVSVVLGGTLVGCASVAAEDAPTRSERNVQQDADRFAREAATYAGDPWEKRFREQFWSTQHIHDSWNRCHLGENVPKSLQQGPGC